MIDDIKDKMVSVIIPTHNRRETIIRAVESVINQTYSIIEIIVVDDCSDDDTLNLLQKIKDSRLSIIKNDSNQGACASRNRGIDCSHGEYVAFLDSDDAWRPEKLDLQINAIKATNCDVCFCRFQRHGYSSGDVVLPSLDCGFINREDLVEQPVISTQTICAKRSVFENYLFDSEMPRLQDYEWAIRASESNQFYLLDDVLVDVYLQNDSITNSGLEKLSVAFNIILDKDINLFNRDANIASYLYSNAGRAESQAGRNPREYYAQALGLNPSLKVLTKYLLTFLHIYR